MATSLFLLPASIPEKRREAQREPRALDRQTTSLCRAGVALDARIVRNSLDFSATFSLTARNRPAAEPSRRVSSAPRNVR